MGEGCPRHRWTGVSMGQSTPGSDPGAVPPRQGGNVTGRGAFPTVPARNGVVDLAGNVWEWVSSAYRLYPYDASDGREDLEPGPVRVTRGGGHDSSAEEIRSTERGRNLSRDYRSGHRNIGFRCAT